MVRIIPWSLPPVKGGSIGGYTPKVDPTPPTPDPEPPAQYFDFSNVAMDPDGLKLYVNSTSLTKDVPGDVVATGIYPGTLAITGIETIDLIGVSSLSVKIQLQGEGSGSTAGTYATDDFLVSLDLATFNPTFVSAKFTVTRTYASGTITNVWPCEKQCDALTLTFYVYNGNGEVIQTEEVELVGGE